MLTHKILGFITNYEKSKRFVKYEKLKELIKVDKKYKIYFGTCKSK